MSEQQTIPLPRVALEQLTMLYAQSQEAQSRFAQAVQLAASVAEIDLEFYGINLQVGWVPKPTPAESYVDVAAEPIPAGMNGLEK